MKIILLGHLIPGLHVHSSDLLALGVATLFGIIVYLVSSRRMKKEKIPQSKARTISTRQSEKR